MQENAHQVVRDFLSFESRQYVSCPHLVDPPACVRVSYRKRRFCYVPL